MIGDDFFLFRHSNKICVLGVAPSHRMFSEGERIGVIVFVPTAPELRGRCTIGAFVRPYSPRRRIKHVDFSGGKQDRLKNEASPAMRIAVLLIASPGPTHAAIAAPCNR